MFFLMFIREKKSKKDKEKEDPFESFGRKKFFAQKRGK